MRCALVVSLIFAGACARREAEPLVRSQAMTVRGCFQGGYHGPGFAEGSCAEPAGEQIYLIFSGALRHETLGIGNFEEAAQPEAVSAFFRRYAIQPRVPIMVQVSGRMYWRVGPGKGFGYQQRATRALVVESITPL